VDEDLLDAFGQAHGRFAIGQKNEAAASFGGLPKSAVLEGGSGFFVRDEGVKK